MTNIQTDPAINSLIIEESTRRELAKKLRALIIARLIVGSTLLVGAAVPLEISQYYSSSRFLFKFITYLLVLTLIYAFLYNRAKNQVLFAYVQMVGDVLLETLVITATGGIESPFSILFVLTIIIGSNLLGLRGAISATIFSIAAFGGVIICQYFGFTQWWPISATWILLPPPSFAFYIIVVNFAGFIIVAFLANHFTERIRKINVLLTNKSYRFHDLLILNDQIVKNIPSGLITSNLEGFIISSNPAAENMFQIKAGGNYGHIREILPDYLVESILKMARSKSLERNEITFQKEIDGEKRWFQFEILPLSSQPADFAQIVLIFNDITDQKKLEETRRKAERWSAVAEISAGMAHEIRNPLASISGSVEVLKDSLTLEPSELKLMQIIIRESDRLNRLITDFLNFAKPRPPELELVNIQSLLKETIILMKNSPQWSDKIKIETVFENDELMLEADSSQFLQLTWNIIKNAIDAMPDEGLLTIKTQLIKKFESDFENDDILKNMERPYIRISFSDTGIGMTSDVIKRIFDPFTTFKRKGIGIGLAIVYRIIENHGGHIRVESSPGKGTTFEIRFPMKQKQNPKCYLNERTGN